MPRRPADGHPGSAARPRRGGQGRELPRLPKPWGVAITGGARGETSVVGLVGGRSRQGSRQAGGEPRGDADQSCEVASVAGGGQSGGRRPTSACTGARAAGVTW